jgi:hypothetical protein
LLKQITCQEVAIVELAVECVLKITLEKILEALTEGHPQLVQAVMIVARRIVFFGMDI